MSTWRAQGLYVVTAGLIVQLIGLVTALELSVTVLVRALIEVRKHGYTTFHSDVGYVPLARRVKILAAAFLLANLLLLVRVFFRVTELSQGHIGRDENLFIGLESLTVALAIILLAGCHPAIFLRDGNERRMSGATPMTAEKEIHSERNDSIGDLEAVGAVARQSIERMGRSWTILSWRSDVRASVRRDRPMEGLQTAMCTPPSG